MITKKTQSGIALLEALIATVILAIGLLGAIGLQARAYAALSEADMRAEANMATEKLVGIMNNDRGVANANLLNYAKTAAGAPSATLKPWHDEVIARMPSAVVTVTVTAINAGTSRVDMSISWIRRTGDKTNTHAITSYISAS
jgi:type IV pilus assembly protein PilV